MPSTFSRSSRIATSLRCIAAAGAVLCAASPALATISNGDDAELFAVVWDPIAKASYSVDLGLNVNDWQVAAQQNAGSQRFWKLDVATDPRFASFRALGTATSDLRWAVMGFDVTNDTFGPGDRRGFFTVQQGATQGTIGAAYAQLVGSYNSDWVGSNDFMGSYVYELSNAAPITDPVNNNHAPNGVFDNAWNGSSFDREGTAGYFGGGSGASPTTFGFQSIEVTNQVGKSSWFYAVTDSSVDGFATVSVDEFDNLSHDAYWGLAQDTDGTLALSYTLVASVQTKLTGAGLVTPVPEPESWALMLAGTAALAGLARRRIGRS